MQRDIVQPVDIEKYLYFLKKPGRYTGNELNTKTKQISKKTLNFVLAFPDLYEIGMSHLGLKILYSILNKHPDFSADRVYAPDEDLIELLKEKNIPLFSVEDKIPLNQFDIVGFTLQYELSYTNILLMLELGQIPLKSKERGDSNPLIIAGGPGAFNPEPLADFIDAFVIGDGEDVILEIADCLLKNRDSKREGKLLALAQIQGVYVPNFYKQAVNKKGSYVIRLREDVPERITRRFFLNFDDPNSIHSPQLRPLTDIVHRRPSYEVMRGCTRGCRFCQAGMVYRPIRERDMKMLLEDIENDLSLNGWEEISLNSLSISDYSCLQPLLLSLLDKLPETETSISLPSLRLDSFDDTFQPKLGKLLGNTVTFAPEAGTQKLRDVINKNITEEEIINSVKKALTMGIRSFKLYFMVGLPEETDEDIKGIIQLIEEIFEISPRRISKINVSIAPFVPKSHTPFQWVAQLQIDEFLRRILIVKHHFHENRKINIKYHTPEQSQIEAVIARGDRSVGRVILQAYRSGAKLDAWDSSFDHERWIEAAENIEIDLRAFLGEIPPENPLPWDHIDSGVKKEFLFSEYRRSHEVLTTQDCRNGACSHCGICENSSPKYSQKYNDEERAESRKIKISQEVEQRFFYKIKYAKGDNLCFISHREISTLIYAIVRKSKLPIYYTKGFNRHPKISFGPPLSLGLAGREEFFIISLKNVLEKREVLEKLDENLPNGFVINEVIPLGSASEKKYYTKELLRISSNACISWNKFLEYKNKSIFSGRKEKLIYLKDFFEDVKVFSHHVDIQKKLGLNIFQILEEAFGFSREQIGTFSIERIKIF
ncbi:MAG TPA: TIGR03960 family B12-binding radical SAM protein [Candidatus Cloacimonetes bacterium]|nr:TIGR03960 family B12-binding radical SAM protein [Candidatus Cloacimonadota bacterium]